MTDAAPKPEVVKLSRELSDFLVDLSIALHRHSMYPSGHPSLDPAVDAVMRRAERLLEGRPTIAFGVARRQLIIEGVTTDPEQPVLRRLAEGLHRHHLGAVSITRGVQPAEIAEALRALAREPEGEGAISFAVQPPEWPHVKLHRLAFDGLALVGDAPVSSGEGGGTARSAELWVGLARAAMSAGGGGESAAEDEPVSLEPSDVARSIDEHPRVEAYDQVIVGYMTQIARELRTSGGAEAAALRRRTSRLVASLRPETLRRIVEMGGDSGQRAAFVLDAAHGMATDAVLDIVTAAADASGQTISHGLVRMLSKLATHAETAPPDAKPLAQEALREQVGQLLSDWHLEDPNPEAHGRLLQHLATSTTASSDDTGDHGGLTGAVEWLRVLQMSLECGGAGPVLERALDRAVAEGQVAAIMETVSAAPEGAKGTVEAVIARLTRAETVRAIIAEPLDLAALDAVLPHLTTPGFDVLLDALAETENRGTRRRLLDRLSTAHADLGPAIVARLDDERWYVQRNMLVLLERAGRVPRGFDVSRWTAHPEARLRSEAIRLQLTVPAERAHAIRIALDDADPRVVRVGLAAIGPDSPLDLVDRAAVLALAQDADDEVRLGAVAALGRVQGVEALDVVLRLCDGGRTLFGRPRLPARTPVLVAAVRLLAEVWSGDVRAARVLAVAAASSDEAIRGAAIGGRR